MLGEMPMDALLHIMMRVPFHSHASVRVTCRRFLSLWSSLRAARKREGFVETSLAVLTKEFRDEPSWGATKRLVCEAKCWLLQEERSTWIRCPPLPAAAQINRIYALDGCLVAVGVLRPQRASRAAFALQGWPPAWRELPEVPGHGTVVGTAGSNLIAITRTDPAVMSFRLDEQLWRRLAHVPMPYGSFHAVVHSNDTLFFWGVRFGEQFHRLVAYDMKRTKWRDCASPPIDFSLHHVVPAGGRLYMQPYPHHLDCDALVYVYDPTHDSWTRTDPPSLPRDRAWRLAAGGSGERLVFLPNEDPSLIVDENPILFCNVHDDTTLHLAPMPASGPPSLPGVCRIWHVTDQVAVG